MQVAAVRPRIQENLAASVICFFEIPSARFGDMAITTFLMKNYLRT